METQRGKKKTMLSFFKPQANTSTSEEHSLAEVETSNRNGQPSVDVEMPNHDEPPPIKNQSVDCDVSHFVKLDPAIRTPIWQCPINQRDAIRRAYILRGPYQPLMEYPRTKLGEQDRRFQKSWFDQFPWLEYSPSKDAAFCFPCFLFQEKKSRYPAFTVDGFRVWKRVKDGKRCDFLIHVGSASSPHNNAVQSMGVLMSVTSHVDKMIDAQTSEEVKNNRQRLSATIESIRWLCLQGCALRGNDESSSSKNQGNFIKLIKLMGKMDVNIGNVVLEKAPKNAKYTSPDIQRDILHILANRVRKGIREEIENAKFCLLVAEAKDISNKEQMSIVLRFVDRQGFVMERFFDIVHVVDTTAVTLKDEICSVLGRHELHIQDIRGQGYDGASNMRGSWNGLQALFLRDSPHAYYIHCFAHRLQLALVGAAEKESSVWLFFSNLTSICNIIKASPKRHTELQSVQAIEIANMVATGIRETCTGLNQIGTLQRAGKTRWSSHFESICSLIDMYSSVIIVLEHMVEESSQNSIRGEASGCLIVLRSFDFVFILYLMHKIMAITDILCRALQEKSLDILNAMDFVSSTKALLHTLRADGYDVLLKIVNSACESNGIEIPDMNSLYRSATRRSAQQKDSITFDHRYRFDVFNAVIDFQIEELNSRFNDGAVELLRLSTALDPRDNFKLFNADNICTLAEKFYPDDFDAQERHYLRSQLEHYQHDIINHDGFRDISTISQLCRRLVETEKTKYYHLIDRLIRRILTLPVSTATTERSFSAMKLLKTSLRNKMEEEFLPDSMIVYLEREFTKKIDTNSVIDEFYAMKNRRAHLK